MSEMSRRELFGWAKTVAVGVATGTAVIPAEVASVYATEELTGRNSGNAGARSRIEEQCKEKGESPEECDEDLNLTPYEKLTAVVSGPFSEELMFRAFPSLLTDKIEDRDDETPSEILAHGSRRGGFTRAEVIGGTISTLIFAELHSLTEKGFDIKNIPTPQFIGGTSLWILQRRFGFLANMVAHSTHNLAILGMLEATKK